MTVKLYGAPWGRTIWLITGSMLLLGVGAGIAVPLLIQARILKDPRTLWLLPVAIFAVISATSLWMIRGFELADDTLIVRRVLWHNRIPLADIASADIDPMACKGAWKICGNDGLFAMHGRFRSRRLGTFQAFVTDPANSIVCRLATDTLVISPDNPRLFLNELSRRLARLKEKS